MKRFLCGVEGVRFAVGKEEDALGGVAPRNPPTRESPDTPGGNAVGIVSSNISERNNDENVRFASSALTAISYDCK